MGFVGFSIIYVPVLFVGLTRAQELELSTLGSKLSEATDETSRFKKAHNQLEKDNASLQLSVKSLQQKHDTLMKKYEDSLKEVKETRKSRTSAKEAAAITGK